MSEPTDPTMPTNPANPANPADPADPGTPPLIRDDPDWLYRGLAGHLQTRRLRVWQLAPGHVLAVVSERDDDEGTSLSNAAELVAAQLQAEHPGEHVEVVEHWPDNPTGERYDGVAVLDGRWPTWWPIPAGDLQARLGASLDEDTREDTRPTAGQADTTTAATPDVAEAVAAAEGVAVFAAVAARMPERPLGEQYDVHARLELDEASGWSEEQITATSRALRLYRCGTWRDLAAYLRHGDTGMRPIRELPGQEPTPEHPADHVALIDQVLQASPLREPVTLWRGLTHADEVFGPQWDAGADMSGAELVESSFCATSADPAVARVMGGHWSGHPDGHTVVLRLHVPAGVGAVQLSGWSSEDRHNAEAEVLLERGLRLRVVADRIEHHGGGAVRFDADGTMATWPPLPYRVFDVEVARD